jgi:CHRD domain-containing protein
MNSVPRTVGRAQRIAIDVFAVLLYAYAICASSQEIKVALSGNQEIPPVATSASGTGTITVNADRSVIGNATITGMSVTVAHIHEAVAGTNGSIVVPLIRTGDNVWSVPPGARLTDAQYESYKAGNLYFNIHSEAHRSGEIRGQIKP